MSDKVIVTRIANALIQDAELSSVPIPHKSTVTRVLGAFKQTHGGLWVGGRVTLTESALEFSANSINRSVTKGQLDVRILLTEITSVTVAFGVVTKIIAIESPAMTFKALLRSGKARRTNQGSNSKYRELTIIECSLPRR